MSRIKLNQLEQAIEDALNETVKRAITVLKTDIQEQWPVDTGRSKAGWKVQETSNGWAVTNNVKAVREEPDVPVFVTAGLPPAPDFLTDSAGFDDSYVPILWNGRQGPGIGSTQLPMGGDPIYQQWLIQTLKPMLFYTKL